MGAQISTRTRVDTPQLRIQQKFVHVHRALRTTIEENEDEDKAKFLCTCQESRESKLRDKETKLLS